MLQMNGGVGTDASRVADQFSSLCKKRRITDDSDGSDRVWGPASQYHSYTSVGRVRIPDESQREDTWKVQGRTGVIIGKRHGYFIMEFNDNLVGVEGMPMEYRGRPTDFEVDITHLHDRFRNGE